MTDTVQEAKTAEGSCPTYEDASAGRKKTSKNIWKLRIEAFIFATAFRSKSERPTSERTNAGSLKILDIVQKEKE